MFRRRERQRSALVIPSTPFIAKIIFDESKEDNQW
jgi:hypothetical protein